MNEFTKTISDLGGKVKVAVRNPKNPHIELIVKDIESVIAYRLVGIHFPTAAVNKFNHRTKNYKFRIY